jgi:hypothetical protein
MATVSGADGAAGRSSTQDVKSASPPGAICLRLNPPEWFGKNIL